MKFQICIIPSNTILTLKFLHFWCLYPSQISWICLQFVVSVPITKFIWHKKKEKKRGEENKRTEENFWTIFAGHDFKIYREKKYLGKMKKTNIPFHLLTT